MLFVSQNRGERKRKSKINPFGSPDLQINPLWYQNELGGY
jgi:hypothetical protein